MMRINPNIIAIGGGTLGAGIGAGAAVAVDKVVAQDSGRPRLVNGLVAGAGGLAGSGAMLLRNTRAFGPLLGVGLGLTTTGMVDAMRSGTALGRADAPSSRVRSIQSGDLLPDGVQAAPTEVFRSGDEIRFDSVVGNAGAAPLQLALHTPKNGDNGSTNQVIFNADGTARERSLESDLALDTRADHSHLHFDDFVFFQMYKAKQDGTPDIEAGELNAGVKQSFYITDIQGFDGVSRANKAAARRLAEGGRVDRTIVKADTVQGISVGMADVYGASLEGQSFKIPNDLAPGRYVLRQTFDPRDQILEQNERNNTADTVIEIGTDGEVSTVRSGFAPASEYITLPDGRQVLGTVVDSLDRVQSRAHQGG